MENQVENTNEQKNNMTMARIIESSPLLTLLTQTGTYLYSKYYSDSTNPNVETVTNCLLAALISNVASYGFHVAAVSCKEEADEVGCDCSKTVCISDPCSLIDDELAMLCCLPVCLAAACVGICTNPKCSGFLSILGNGISCFFAISTIIVSDINVSKSDLKLLIIAASLSILSSLVQSVSHTMRRSCFKHVCSKSNSTAEPLLSSTTNKSDSKNIPIEQVNPYVSSYTDTTYTQNQSNNLNNPYEAII